LGNNINIKSYDLRQRMYRFYADFRRYYTTNAYYQVISQANPERFTAHILDNLKDGDKVLEVGSASGVMVMEAARVAGFAVGVDISPVAGRFAARLARIEKERYKLIEEFDRVNLNSERLTSRSAFIAADVERLPFRDGCFDACIARDVIEHFVDWRAALDEVRRCLKPGGRLFIELPVPKSINVNLDRDQWAKRHGAMSDRDALHRVKWANVLEWAEAGRMSVAHREIFYRFKWIGRTIAWLAGRFPRLADTPWFGWAERLIFVHMIKGSN